MFQSRHVLRYLAQTRPLLVRPLISSPARTLFSKDYLDVMNFQQNQDKTRATFAHPNRLREFRQDLPQQPLLLGEDVVRYIQTTAHPEEVNDAAQLIKRFMMANKEWCQDPQLPHATTFRWLHGRIMREFLNLCHVFQDVDAASDMWNDGEVVDDVFLFQDDQTLSSNVPTVVMTLGDLLFKNRRYTELFEVLDRVKVGKDSVVQSFVTLDIAACYKMNTPESLMRASGVINRHRHFTNRTKSGLVYALLTYQQGHVRLALEEACLMRQATLTSNVKIFLLTELGRLDWAMDVLASHFPSPTDAPVGLPQSPRFSKEVIAKLAAAVNAANDAVLSQRLVRLFTDLDNVAEVSTWTLEEMLLSPIAPSKINQIPSNNKKVAKSRFAAKPMAR
ncbi:pentatricopeptide repeat-containing protein 2, mitochondrial-like [Tigriopus californicus]|uniref:pentatricopeptide repeat-containing protein 2, mitochondrial-like n=1 Tax=Tigriopus californicus TaxID=6832 RepID=UPI0027D9D971|nr:pentatricopeptide repeat-containing protein 2, mitochondrial-like [Tigriopus californicus]